MPSRKKAQGKARKAKQAAEAKKNNLVSNGFSYGCDHVGERNWSRDDYDAAYGLLSEYRSKYDELARVSDKNRIAKYETSGWANATYDKYQQLSDGRKDLFRRFLLAAGTEYCVDAANEKDLTKEVEIDGPAMIYLVMVLTVELRDKYNEADDSNDFQLEFLVSLSDLIYCPRQAIKFFHRRNFCDCLQDIYYKLKQTTNKTSHCYNCRKVVEIKQLSRCEYCKSAQYCSYDCALVDWPKHKVSCEGLGYYKPNRPAKSEHDLEEVD
eukprot:scaffold88721_cov23-Cyclotella_meneghiniana.AAC.2